MHVRLAQPARARRALTVLVVVAAVVAPACGRTQGNADDVRATWRLDPPAPALGQDVRVRLTLRDPAGEPARGARLRIEAHMAHPGMPPVVAEAAERDPGVYEADLGFTMAGGWTFVADGTLSDGRRLTRTFDVADVR